jgi:hypothetical protein
MRCMEKIFKVRLRFMFHYYTALTDPPLRPMLRRDMAGRKVETWAGQIKPDRVRLCLIARLIGFESGIVSGNQS